MMAGFGGISLRLLQVQACVWLFAAGAAAHKASAKVPTQTGNQFLTHFELVHLGEIVQGSLHRVRRDLPIHRQQIHFSFSAFSRDFSLQLWQDGGPIAPDVKMTVVDQSGPHQAKFPRTSLYHGHLADDRSSYVYGAIINETFRGVIHTLDESYHLEPAHFYVQSTPKHDSIMYKESDVHHPWHSNCSSGISRKLRKIQESAKLLRESHHRHRRAFDENRKTCQVAVVADHTFFESIGGGDESTTIQEMVFHITEASRFFGRTKFVMPSNGETVEGVNFQVQRITVYSDAVTSPFAGTFGTDEMLQAFSALEFDDVCLGHLFLYRDFPNGVLGLAWVASPSNSIGGICQKRTTTGQGQLNLNTGYTTLLNFGSKVPRSISMITTTHEFGHNFGSPHDTTAQCAPGGNEGNYIMYPSATDGTKPHNTEFSSCSIGSISAVLDKKATCFMPYRDKNVCGNGVVEGNEQCDCGSSDEATCWERDPCCKPGNCTLLPGMDCSAVADLCCVKQKDANRTVCRFAPKTHTCRLGDECRTQTFCDFGNSTCPPEEFFPDGTLCNQNSSTCTDGVCSGSLCSSYDEGVTDCECNAPGQECDLCCEYQGRCNSTFNFHIPGKEVRGVFRGANTPCMDYKGYCPGGSGQCISVDDQKPLDGLKDVFDTISLSSIVQWVENNWPATLGAFGGCIVLFILLRVTYRPKKLAEDLDESVPLISQRRRR